MLFRIVAPHFVAGLISTKICVMQAAPIIKYMVGWTPHKVLRYCQNKRWTMEYVP